MTKVKELKCFNNEKKKSELEARLIQLKDRVGNWENIKYMNTDFSNLSQDQVQSKQKLKS